MSVTFTDFFCGFGGSSQGLTEAGLTLKWAANHWDRAIETHSANFRDADHFQGDISGFDMRRVPAADMAWMSPECTWHSPAGGRKKLRAELDLFDDYVATDGGERSRATMWDVIRAAEAKQFKVLIVENVVEVTTWPLFDDWLHSMESLGYEHQIVCVTAAHIGGDLNPYAPQWRDRIYVVEPYVLPAAAAIDWSDLGIRISDRDKPLAPATMRRIEAGIRMFSRPIVTAAAGQTYDAASEGHPRSFYRVAPADSAPLDTRMTTGGDGVAVPPFMASVNHGEDAHGRSYLPDEQPLPTRSTKIGDGLVVAPFLSRQYNSRTGAEGNAEHLNTGTDDEPLHPITASGGGNHALVSPPMIVAGYDHQGGDARRVKPAFGAPLGTVVANGRGHHQLVVPPMIADLHGTGTARSVENDALGAITAGGNHHGLATPEGAFIQKHHGGLDYAGVEHMVKGVDEPLPSIVARANVSLVIPYRRGRAARAVEGPLPTMTTSNTTAIVEPDFTAAELEEIVQGSRFRMLGPREHLRAQRFPDSYIVKGNKSEQTKGAGNAVASNVAHWLGTIVLAALGTPAERAA